MELWKLLEMLGRHLVFQQASTGHQQDSTNIIG